MTDEELRAIIGEPEGNVQNNVIDYLKSQGYMVLRLNAGKGRYNIKLAPAGTPDILAVGIQDIWIELKKPGKEPTQVQLDMHKRLRDKGKWVIVVHSVEELKIKLDPTCGNT